MRWWSSYLHRAYIELRSLLFTLDMCYCSLGLPSGMFLSCSFSVTPLRQILSRWVYPCLFMGWNISSRGKNRCSRINLSHDLWAPCILCLLVVLENQSPIHSWLFDELSKLQSCLELCRFTQALLQPGIARWETPFQLELARESDYDTHLNGWHITRDTQSKWRMSYF
jgi:hypothetical protein